MKKLSQEVDKMLGDAGRNIANLVASSAFDFWNRKDFRLYVNFNSLDRTEQDRIFNELEVSAIGLFTLQLDDAILLTSAKEQKIVFDSLQKSIVSGFLKIMLDLGIANKFLEQWKALIDMRLEEYTKDLKIAHKESSRWEELKNEDKEIKLAWARVETITIDSLTHIRRGDVEKDDPLWKLLRKWFLNLDSQIAPITNLAQ